MTVGSVVYALSAPVAGLVKIGRTSNLRKRFAEIQAISPVPLELLWSVPGGSELEAYLHREFWMVRAHGEWFRLGDDPVDMIEQAVAEKRARQARHQRHGRHWRATEAFFSGSQP